MVHLPHESPIRHGIELIPVLHPADVAVIGEGPGYEDGEEPTEIALAWVRVCHGAELGHDDPVLLHGLDV